ncbi:3-oxoacyl-ACP synthase III family protein [Mobilicoccus pelagius]|uniref:3-oxoacyl-[acyl-carrier-protein] synthase III n=1 Tax=Mobilicoccus pelagius NBRC 104925 TaxID=1089455 RepID=H5UQ43_9MICO|nr:beta-ketoacyl-ACP synthase 3 [Mobilicoccus pelagius]GAB47848.1 3-oxoacyl-[acyl-carrier-protein] synthase III [Mobilicoccus pelagius NBRC 104925]
MNIAVWGTGAYVPDRVVDNDEVGRRAGVNDEWITSKTGIKERRWVANEQATSDLAIAAARQAVEASGVAVAELTTIIVATSSPDHPQPPTAVYVQEALGAQNAAAFDMNAVCSGFVFAMAVGARMIAGGGGYALVIGADVYSRILNPEDRRTVVLFGDGAGAVVLGPSKDSCHGVVATQLHTFGDLNDRIIVPAGGSRLPMEDRHHETGLAYFTMQGRAVKEFVLRQLPPLVADFLASAGVSPDEVDHFVPHQANGLMLTELLPALKLTNAEMHDTVIRYGNTGAASVGITLDDAARAGRLSSGDLVLLAGFGGGMAAGLALLRW